MNDLLKWYIYDISAESFSLNGVMLRGRIRKLGIKHNFNVIAENTEDRENGVRFAVLNQDHAQVIAAYLITLSEDISISLTEEGLVNPVLSKLKVNLEDRYTL